MKRLLFATFVFLLVSSPHSAKAYDVSWGRVATTASYVYLEWIWIDARTTVTFRTDNLSGGGDTVMFLYRPSIQAQVAKNDDYPGAGLASQITYTTGSAGTWYTLIVMAYDAESAGTCDIYQDRSLWRTNVPFAGQPVTIGPAQAGPGTDIRTAEHAGGVTDTVLYGFSAAGDLVEVNDDDWGGSGRRSDNVGWMSRLEPTVVTTAVVVGTYSQAESGPVWLIVNDAFPDVDNDGLGELLEEALCTCDSPAKTTCSLPCTGLATTIDSDGDGIADDWEVYGVHALSDDAYGFTQPLARWGANPAHKDIFVEVDRHFQTAAVEATTLQLTQVPYSSVGTATQMANRDGVAGVALHCDVGPNSGCGASSTLCGDWGGAGELPVSGSSYKTPSLQEFVASRRGIFHYGHSKGEQGGQGQMRNVHFIAYRADGLSIAHELGHNVDLGHGGCRTAADYNGKPNYHSLMNYAFAAHPGFSQGAYPSLKPTALCEAEGLRTTTCAELAHIGGGQHDFLTQKLPGESYCGVDWNRDGVVSPCASEADLVEAAPNLLKSSAGSPELGRYYWEWERTVAFQPGTADPDPTASPSIARAWGRLYIAHRMDSGHIRLTYTTDSFRRLCKPINGTLEASWGCASWTMVTLPFVATAGKGPALVTTKESTLMVVYHDAAGLQYRTLLPNHTVQYSGVVTNSADLHGEPVVAVGPVGRPRVVFRTGTSLVAQVYMATFDGLAFSAPVGQVETVGGVDVPLSVVSVNGLAPGMGPSGEELHMVAGRLDPGAFGGTVNTLHWYRLNTIQTAWLDNQTNIDSYMGGPTTRRVGLAFRSYFGSSNAEFGGRYYVVYTPGGAASSAARVRTTRGDTVVGNRLDWVSTSYFDNSERDTDAGVALLGWERVIRFEPSVRYVGIFNDHIDFKPFADGIVPIILKDTTDWQQMERGICGSLQSVACKSYLGTGDPTVQW